MLTENFFFLSDSLCPSWLKILPAKGTKQHKVIFLVTVVFLITSCLREPAENKHVEVISELQAEIATCKIEKRLIKPTIECAGKIDVPQQSLTSVSVPMGGNVKRIHYSVGDFVSEGTILATLEHVDYIKLQQKYLEAKSSFDFNELEYKRQAELAIENATSMKKMQMAKRNYEVSEVALLSLKTQLEMMGYKPNSIKSTNIKSSIHLKTPISGNIQAISANTGKFVGEGETLFRIANDRKRFLSIEIPEDKILKVKQGQIIDFFLTGYSIKSFQTTVVTIENFISDGMATIRTDYLENEPEFMLGMAVKAIVRLPEEEIYVFPATAVMNEEGQSFIYKKAGEDYKRLKIETGITHEDWVEVIDPSQNLIDSEFISDALKHQNLIDK